MSDEPLNENLPPPPPRRSPPPDVWTLRRRRSYPPTIVFIIVMGIGLLFVGVGTVVSRLGPMLLGGYNGCPGVSNLQAFQQIEEYAVLKFPERFQLNGNRFSVEFDLRARNECDIFVRFDLEPTQLDSFLGSTLLKTRTALSSTAKPDAFGKYQERTAWPIGRVASYLAGDARSPIYAGERTQSLLIDIDDPTRYVVYVIVNVVGFSS